MNPDTPAPSPGPALPGAWPSPRPAVDSLHLEHVLGFQQRLVSQMDKSETPSTSFAASVSADSAITPADSLNSQLTRFRTETSTSIATDTSASTTYTSRSSPERLVTAKLPPLAFKTKYSAVDNNYPTRIPRHTDFVRGTPDQTRVRSQRLFSSDSPSPPRVPDMSPSSSGIGRHSNSPLSPIVFASPASSSFPRVAASQSSPHNRSSSYEYNSSPSWETSYGSEYDDRQMLNPSPSPSPSPLSGRSHLVARSLSADNRTPSIEISPAVPMLTSLSLPASPDNSLSLDMDPISPRLSPIDGDASPWTLSLSPTSPVISILPDLSLSSPTGNTVDGHVVSFPSMSSSSSPFLSPLPSPVLDDVSEEHVGDTSAAEYAAAIMSSAWAPDGPSMAQVIPFGLLSTENEMGPIAQVEQTESVEEEELPAPLAYLDNVQSFPSRQEVKTSGVLGKMKKFSDKFKKLLRGKSKTIRDGGGVNVDVDVRRVGGRVNSPLPDALPDVIDIQSHTSAAQAYDSLLSNHSTDSHLPLPRPPPPGLLVHATKTRPILSSQTYSSTLARTRTNDNTTPMIRIRPPSSSGHVEAPISNDIAPKNPSPDLTVHSRPKTLAEIKSKRRLSLSALSSFTRSSSPAPPVNVVTPNRNRTRPASALAFYPRPPPLSSFRVADNNNTPTNQRLEVPRSTSFRLPSAAATSGSVRSDIAPAHSSTVLQKELTADATKKKKSPFLPFRPL
ncbi:hypothetical protein DFH06DRAFT_74249 [Mycena polygramma]|nr:hypothetical protein DFH06DRAFT_74249 [Mycena polygramma]